MIHIDCVASTKDFFGESPVWSGSEQALYWVDVKAPAIHRFDPGSGAVRTIPVLDEVGSIALRHSGGLVAATRRGFGTVDLTTGAIEYLLYLNEQPEIRFNDGKCDRAGRFWCGTLDDVGFSPVGALYRIGADRRRERLDDGFVLVNGIAWSPDNRTMYVADSRREVVYAYDYEIGDGSIHNRRPFIQTDEIEGRVDGATVAADGTYWCAHVRGWQVAQYDPSGRLLQAIRLPVKYPLMCSFGGVDLDVLYVTTSRAMLAVGEASEQPLAGALFAIHGCGSRGLQEVPYAG